MSAHQLLDAAGRPALARDDARPPRRADPAEQRPPLPSRPATVDEIVAVMRQAGDGHHGRRMQRPDRRALARRPTDPRSLMLTETDLDERRGQFWSGMGRATAVARSAWTRGHGRSWPWLAERATLPSGPLFCVIAGPTAGHAWSAGAAQAPAAPASG